MEIGRRIFDLRKQIGLNQADFGKRIGVTRSAVCNYENGSRSVGEQAVLAICREFSVSKDWLQTGAGEMFVETEKGVISSLVSEYCLDALDRKIVECYLNLGPLQRKVIKDYLRSLVDAVLSDESYDEYREGYIKENASAVAARGGHSEQIGELKDLYDNGDSEEK